MRKYPHLFILLSWLMVWSPDTLAQKSEFKKLDPRGKVVRMTESYYTLDPVQPPGQQLTLDYYYINYYDNYGNRVEDQLFGADSLLQKRYRYTNQADRRLLLRMEDGTGKLIRTIRYSYGPMGRLLEDQSFDADSVPEKRFVYVYDDKNRVTEDFSYYENGELNMRFTYAYDHRGDMVENKRFKADKSLFEIRKYKYNELHDVVEERVFDANDQLKKTIRRQYVYDKKDNWTEQTVLIDNLPSANIKRNIEY